ncbi:MAG: methylenetetrahydrofolate reductase [NAD(P)H] [bacterium]|nr:methylenetetrahydrofolate reductase [NAD(P)H] [Deltaproteobacteria bacterium]MCP4907186.1 methylenetetrahydrofolate reductase [NAD(P)H] [bacterium]
MLISEIYRNSKDPIISFEFFPPKTDAGYRTLFRTIEDLKQLAPGFVSVTMGAGGSTRSKTVDLTVEITREIGLVTMCHLPCTGFRPREIGGILEQLKAGDVHNVLALRGDPPQDDPDFEAPTDGFRYANELVAYIAERDDRDAFSIGAACAPETHPEAPDAATDIANIKRKVDAGADFLVSNFFFENAHFFDFVERCRAAGIEVPIVPGIMPIATVSGIRRMAAMNGTAIPAELDAELERVDDDAKATYALGVRWATIQCEELLARGVDGIQFYTLNRSPASREIFENLFG